MDDKVLSKEDIVGCEDLPSKSVSVKEWKGNVLVRGLTAEERDSFEVSVTVDGKMTFENFRAKFCAMCIVDKDGKRLFDDYKILAKKNAKAISRIFDVAQKLSGMGAGDVEELIKNSDADQPA